jgi:DNA polymerase-3 subunit alpha
MAKNAKGFANLHNHSEYSLLDGKSKVKDMVKRAKEMGQESLGMMDHGNCFGHVEFHDECTKQGIKPILGCEFYFVVSHLDENCKKTKQKYTYHLSIMAMNNAGLTTMNRLNWIAAKNYYYKPRISMQDLRENNEGLIMLSGCYASLISTLALNDQDGEAVEAIKDFKEIFGDRFYMEVQDSGVPGQDKIKEKCRKWAKRFDIPCMVSNDSHYVNPEDSFAHSVLLAINTGCKMSDKPMYEGGRRFAFSANEYYMKDRQALLDEGWTGKEISTTVDIADRCHVTIDKSPKLPVYPYLPAGTTSIKHLRDLCKKGWTEKRIDSQPYGDYEARLRHELGEIDECNLADYFLIVAHYIRWAKEKGIPVGPGRGSAAGSLTSYLLGITTIDPLRYGLYWERFWNKGRAGVGMPDIDSDFGQNDRQKVLGYIKKTFGADRVLPVISFGRMMVKGVLKDVGRTLSIPIAKMNVITAGVPHKATTLEEALADSLDLRESKKKFVKLFAVAEQLQNTVRHTSIHPSAVVILDKPVQEGSIPLTWDTRSKQCSSAMCWA